MINQEVDLSSWEDMADFHLPTPIRTPDALRFLRGCDYLVDEDLLQKWVDAGLLECIPDEWTRSQIRQVLAMADLRKLWHPPPSIHDCRKSKYRLARERISAPDDLDQFSDLQLIEFLFATENPDHREMLYEFAIDRLGPKLTQPISGNCKLLVGDILLSLFDCERVHLRKTAYEMMKEAISDE